MRSVSGCLLSQPQRQLLPREAPVPGTSCTAVSALVALTGETSLCCCSLRSGSNNVPNRIFFSSALQNAAFSGCAQPQSTSFVVFSVGCFIFFSLADTILHLCSILCCQNLVAAVGYYACPALVFWFADLGAGSGHQHFSVCVRIRPQQKIVRRSSFVFCQSQLALLPLLLGKPMGSHDPQVAVYSPPLSGTLGLSRDLCA